MKAQLAILLLALLCSAMLVLSQATTAAPAGATPPPPTTTTTKPSSTSKKGEKKKDEEDATIGDLIKSYELSPKKTEFVARQVSLQKAEDVASFVKFITSDNFQAQRFVMSNIFDVKDDSMKSILSDGLSKSKSLKSLAIAKIPLGPQSCSALASLISSAPLLEKVHLYRTKIGADCVKTLIDTGFSKAVSKTLSKIVLVENPIGDEGFKYLVEFATSEHSLLTDIAVRDGRLTVASAKQVELLLTSAKPLLTHVDLSENPKLSLGFQDIMNGLAKSTLKHFEFGYGELTATHAAMIAQMLSVNRQLARLDVSENEFGNKGAQQIAQVLGNSSLGVKIQRLDLSSCEIEDEGAVALVKSVTQENKDSVGVMYLFRNEINNNATHQLLAQHGDKVKSEYMSEQHAAQLEKESEQETELSEIEGEDGEVDEEEEGSSDKEAEGSDEMIDEEGGDMDEEDPSGAAGEDGIEDMDGAEADEMGEETENDVDLEAHSFLKKNKKNGAASSTVPKHDEL